MKVTARILGCGSSGGVPRVGGTAIVSDARLPKPLNRDRAPIAMLRPSLAVLGSALAYAFSHTMTRKLAQIDTPLTILFYMTLIQLPLGLVTSIFDWTTPTVAMLPWIMVVGVSALSGHYCMARALALADAIVVVPMDFLRLPLIATIGVAIYGEPLNWLVLAGGSVMFAGNLINIRAEQKRSRGLAKSG